MKHRFLGLIGLALLGGSPLLGQTPPPAPSDPNPAPDGVIVLNPAPGGVIVPNPAPGGIIVGAPLDCPEGPDCCPTRTICVPEHYTKKTDKVSYCCRSEPLCLCFYHGLHSLFRGCECGHPGHCEHPYTRRYLVKKIRVCEEEAIKCVPKQVPACGPDH